MKLTKEEIHQVELYIEFKNLNQVDLKYEVLDHMVSAIEDEMSNGLSFIDAFDLAIKNWKEDLKPYSSYWLGLAFCGPKLMIKKCVRLIKKIYVISIPVSALISVILLFVFDFITNQFFYNILNVLMSVLFGVLFLVAIIGLHFINKSKVQTTYRYFYKIQGFGYGLMLGGFVIAFPNEQYFTSGMPFLSLFLPVFCLVFYYHMFKIYKEHFGILKQKFA